MTLSQALKDAGMAQAADKKKELLARARQIVLTAAYQNPDHTATADDVPDQLRRDLANAAGSIFKGSDFEFTGNRVNSKLDSNHARELKVWKLTPTGLQKVEAQANKVAAHTQAEDRTRRQPVTPEIVEVAPSFIPEPTPLPGWLK